MPNPAVVPADERPPAVCRATPGEQVAQPERTGNPNADRPVSDHSLMMRRAYDAGDIRAAAGRCRDPWSCMSELAPTLHDRHGAALAGGGQKTKVPACGRRSEELLPPSRQGQAFYGR